MRRLVDVAAEAIMANVCNARRVSHRPDNVSALWQDANSRHSMARAMLEAVGLNPDDPASPDGPCDAGA